MEAELTQHDWLRSQAGIQVQKNNHLWAVSWLWSQWGWFREGEGSGAMSLWMAGAKRLRRKQGDIHEIGEE